MRKYIVDLTNNLIANNNFDKVFGVLKRDEFLTHVKNELHFGEVFKMNPMTLGKIMCSFEFGDVMADHPGKEVTFSGNCEDMLREMVALCLAYVIRDRLDTIAQECRYGIPPYSRKLKASEG